MSAPPIAYSYVRFSSPEQAKGDSRRRQEELRDAWLSRSGAVLDTSLTLRDEGVSAYTGAHRSNPDRHGLASFLALVQSGRIPRGSYLVVESLDRLSREDIRPALTLLLNLIEAGVRVVQLLPVEAVYDDKVEPMALMVAIMELSRGNSESRTKSERVGGAWARKKGADAQAGAPITRAIPAWLRVEGGDVHARRRKPGDPPPTFTVDEARAELVRRIYRLAADGYGLGLLAKTLNREGVPTMGRGRAWGGSSVHKILTNRSVLGEYQPYTMRNGGPRRKDGGPIPGYFPRVVSDDLWHAAQGAMAGRRQAGGRPARGRVHLFAGMVRDALTGATLHMVDKGAKGGGPVYVAERGSLAPPPAFPANTLEAAVLSLLRELDPAELLPNGGGAAVRALEAAGRLEGTERRIAAVKAALLAGDDLAPLVDVLRTLEARRQAEAEELAGLQREASSPLSSAWADCKSLLDVVERAGNDEPTRLRLRSALRRIVEGVYVVVVPRGSRRLAAVQLWFGGGKRRDFVILHTPARGGFMKPRPASWEARSLTTDHADGDLDLRDRSHAERLERVLLALPLG